MGTAPWILPTPHSCIWRSANLFPSFLRSITRTSQLIASKGSVSSGCFRGNDRSCAELFARPSNKIPRLTRAWDPSAQKARDLGYPALTLAGCGRKEHTSGAEAQTHFQRLNGTSKLVPFPKPALIGVFPQAVKSCPSHNPLESGFYRSLPGYPALNPRLCNVVPLRELTLGITLGSCPIGIQGKHRNSDKPLRSHHAQSGVNSHNYNPLPKYYVFCRRPERPPCRGSACYR